MTDRDTDHDDDLDRLLAEARALAPAPSRDLMARILADAGAVTAERRPPAPAPARARPGWGLTIARALGGWPAAGAFLASSVLGVTLGVAQPAGLAGLTAAVGTAVWGEDVSVAIGTDEDPLSLLEG